LRLFSFGGYGLALAALTLVDFGAIECPPSLIIAFSTQKFFLGGNSHRKTLKASGMKLVFLFG